MKQEAINYLAIYLLTKREHYVYTATPEGFASIAAAKLVVKSGKREYSVEKLFDRLHGQLLVGKKPSFGKSTYKTLYGLYQKEESYRKALKRYSIQSEDQFTALLQTVLSIAKESFTSLLDKDLIEALLRKDFEQATQLLKLRTGTSYRISKAQSGSPLLLSEAKSGYEDDFHNGCLFELSYGEEDGGAVRIFTKHTRTFFSFPCQHIEMLVLIPSEPIYHSIDLFVERLNPDVTVVELKNGVFNNQINSPSEELLFAPNEAPAKTEEAKDTKPAITVSYQPPNNTKKQSFDLDQELYRFNGSEPFTIRQACEGVQIFGGVGAGKTSGSGAALAHAYLKAGFGGLVLCAKQTVLEDWLEYAKATGREDDIIVMDASGNHCFPFLQYEVQREGDGAGMTENVIRIFTAVFNAINRTDSGKSNDQYWVRSMQQLLRNAVDLIILAGEQPSVPLISELISSAPYSEQERDSAEWQKKSECWKLLIKANERKISAWEKYDFNTTVTYWMEEFPKLSPRTRSGVISTLTSMLDGLNRRPFRMLFSEVPENSEKILYPDLSHEGKIIILNFPVKEFGETGRSAQIIYKYLWQQAAERRDITKNDRPIFLWADEAQYFATDYDMEFQTTARSSRACTVYITQNLPNYYAQMGKGNAYFVDSLVNNLQTKIWHANSDPLTNKNASEIIGQSWQKVSSLNYDMGPALDKRPLSQTVMDSYQYDVGHKHFTSLLKGGPQNNYTVEAYIFQNGRTWDKGESYLKALFDQRYPDGNIEPENITVAE